MNQHPEGSEKVPNPLPAEPETAPERPAVEEDMGPVPELLKAAGAEAAAEATGDESLVEEELGVQPEGIGGAQILGFIFAILAVIAMAIVFVIIILSGEVRDVQGEFAAGVDYPELREVEAQAARLLGQYEVIDADAGVYRIPIDEAIEQIANQTFAAPGGPYSPELQLLPGN